MSNQITRVLGRLAAVPFLAVAGAAVSLYEAAQDHGLVRSSFRIGDRVVHRPKSFDGASERIVFAIVGEELERRAADGADLNSFTDREIARIPRYARHSLETWWDVLDFFASQGILSRAWRLRLPDGRGGWRIPTWDAHGNPLPGNRAAHPQSPIEEEPWSFWPSQMDANAKARALTALYASEPRDDSGTEPTKVLIRETHFECYYILPSGASEWPHAVGHDAPRF